MNKVKSTFIILFILLMALSFSSCKEKEVMSKTFTAEGDIPIEVTLDISDGHTITDSLPFDVMKGEKELSKVTFIPAETIKDIREMLKSDPKAKVLEEGTNKTGEYIFWQYEFKPDNYEYDYILILKDSGLAAFSSNVTSKASAMDCIEKLTYDVK